MIALLALSGAFVAPLPSRAAARARMAADDAPAPSDRYTMADPTGMLRSFFTGEKRQKKNAGFYTGLDADGEVGFSTAQLSANAANRLADAVLDLAQASASDLAAALVAQRGRAEAEGAGLVRCRRALVKRAAVLSALVASRWCVRCGLVAAHARAS